MMSTMPHRGPDGAGLWVSGPVGLGHLMLRVTPESLHERQPYVHPARRIVITAEARIDNRGELISMLGWKGPEAPADSQLILAAYERWGTACVDHLLGSFAFAIWDEHERTLFCARDHIGDCPLFYYHEPGRFFAFATEIKALLPLPEVPRRLSEAAIADFLANLTGDVEGTFFEGIKRLPAAHRVSITQDHFDLRRYWTLEPIDVPAASDRAYAEQFRELFDEAVRCRLRSAFPVGVQLSGGLDSSFVACVARDQLVDQGRDPLHTFSVIFDHAPESDEREYIEEVLKTGGFEPHYISVAGVGPISNLDEEYRYIDTQPSAGAHHMIWTTYRATQQYGVRVLLDGVDGDTTVQHGHVYFRELARAGRWEEFKREALLSQERLRGADHRHSFEESLSSWQGIMRIYGLEELNRLAVGRHPVRLLRSLHKLGRLFPELNTRGLLRLYVRRMVASMLPTHTAHRAVALDPAIPSISLFNPAFAARVRLAERIERFGSRLAAEPTVRARHLAMFRANILSMSLEPANYSAAAFGFEVRHPFFDRRLIEFCVSLPPEQSFSEGWTRVIMRRAMEGVVPTRIQWRVGKANMEPAFLHGLQVVDGERLAEVLNNAESVRAYIAEDELQRLSREEHLIGYDLDRAARIASLCKFIERGEAQVGRNELAASVSYNDLVRDSLLAHEREFSYTNSAMKLGS